MRFQSDFFVTAFQNWREMGKADDEEEELDRETVGRCLIWWWWCGANGGDDDVDCEEADNDDGCGGETVDDGEADVFFFRKVAEELPAAQLQEFREIFSFFDRCKKVLISGTQYWKK